MKLTPTIETGENKGINKMTHFFQFCVIFILDFWKLTFKEGKNVMKKHHLKTQKTRPYSKPGC